jgi:hypothetical protein
MEIFIFQPVFIPLFFNIGRVVLGIEIHWHYICLQIIANLRDSCEPKNQGIMKKFLLFLAVIFSFVQVFAQEAKEKGPKIEFKTKEINYGEVPKGSDGYRVFEFTNTGDEPLVISRVRSSCGCTVAERPEEPIMPGQSGKIKVHYNTNHVGSFRKTVTVYTNAVNEPNGVVVLKVKGKVIDPASVDLKKKGEESPVFN